MKKHILPGIILITLTAVLMSSCTKWLENEFHPLAANLYPIYEEGDTFMYRSTLTEDIDTFVVSEFNLDTVFNGSILFEQTFAAFGQIVADTFGGDFFYVFNYPDGASFIWDSAYVSFVNTIASLDTTIQDFTYNDLLVAASVRSDTISDILYKVYFDWNYGLVKYVQNNLDTYELFYRPE